MELSLKDSVILTRFRQTAKDVEQTGFRDHVFLFGFGILMFISSISLILLQIGSGNDMENTIKTIFIVYALVEIFVIIVACIRMVIPLKKDIIRPRKDIIRILYGIEEGIGNIRPSCLFILLNLITFILCFKFTGIWFSAISDLNVVYGFGLTLITAALVFDLVCISVLMILRYQALHYDPAKQTKLETQ